MSRAPSPAHVAEVNGVKIVGYSNPGRLAASASSLYARNLYAFLEILIDKKTKALAVNWDDDIVKATALTRDGAVVHPNFAAENRRLRETPDGHNQSPGSREPRPRRRRSDAPGGRRRPGLCRCRRRRGVHAATGGAIDPFVFRLSIFVLAVFVGYYVVWSVTPALHTPLMSVTNAISSVIVVGALLAVGVTLVGNDGGPIVARALGFVALVFASMNIFGGFLVTQRMLAMYQKKKK